MALNTPALPMPSSGFNINGKFNSSGLSFNIFSIFSFVYEIGVFILFSIKIYRYSTYHYICLLVFYDLITM
ncbi:hypothetical protein CFSAN002367_27416 [Clostridium botulinum CFSAN002367]|nr:hypothetical protein CFSAN002367_27416 [Clostridium botulinum CFSAN002367]